MKSKNWSNSYCMYSLLKLLESICLRFLDSIFGQNYLLKIFSEIVRFSENLFSEFLFFNFQTILFWIYESLILDLPKLSWSIEFPRFRILKNFLIFGEYNWPLNFAQNPKPCMTSSTFRHECYHSDVMSDVIRVTSWFAIFPVKFNEFVREN